MRHGKRITDDERRREDDRPAPPEAVSPPSLLDLQRTAGNRAVSAMLARQPAAGDEAGPVPASEETGTSMTLGLGDDIGVIPLESANWGAARGGRVHELHVSFLTGPVAIKVQQAATDGRQIPSAFFSTSRSTATMSGVVLSGYATSPSPGRQPLVNLTLDFAGVEFERVG